MKKLSMSGQKFLKAIHLIAVGLWLSCVIVLLVMPVIARQIVTGEELYMYNIVYHFIDMYILTPAAIVTLCTGIVYSLFTKWGFFKHGWLVYKWIATLAIIISGTFYLGPMVTKMLAITDLKRLGALSDTYYLQGVTVGIWAAIINTLLLLVAVFFSVYKPWKNIKKIG
ncbi:MAG: hypothetical protein ACN4GW_13410 [Desulforhopalus sp.]